MNPVTRRTHQFLGLLALAAVATLVLAACAAAAGAEIDPPEAGALSPAASAPTEAPLDVLPPSSVTVDWPEGLQPFADLPAV